MIAGEVREGIVVKHTETGATGTVLKGGYRPRVQWHPNQRTVRCDEELLRFVAEDEISFRRAERDKAAAAAALEWIPGPDRAGVQFRPIMHDYWGWNWQQWGGVLRDSGHRIVNPFHHLERRAEMIANGCLVHERLKLQGLEIRDIWTAQEQFPGSLDVRGQQAYGHPRPGRPQQRTGVMAWSITWREAGDEDSSGMCIGRGGPDEVLARMIETCEEHHREELEKMVEHTGGLA